MSKALLLIVTPLQAHVAQKALEDLGNPEYDLLFFTRFRNTQTELAFNKLAKHADNAKLFSTSLRRPDLGIQLIFWMKAIVALKKWRPTYSIVVFGSVDSPFLTGLAFRTGGKIVTVDDGVANISRDSTYFVIQQAARNRLQRGFFGAPSLNSFKELIGTHYTLFPGFENIVPQKKVKRVHGWGSRTRETRRDPEMTFIVNVAGQFGNQNSAIEEYVRGFGADFFVAHPMQNLSSLPGVPELDKRGQLGEDAILEAAGDRNIHLLGTFSTLFLSLGDHAVKKTLIIPSGEEKYIEIGKKLGCDIVRLG